MNRCLQFFTGGQALRGISEQKIISRVKRRSGFARFVFILLAVVVLQFAAVTGLIVSGGASDAAVKTDYLLILGARLFGETPSDSLQERLKAGVLYLEKYPDAMAIVSGGQGRGEDITEAEAMRRFLVAAGIDEGRIITESKAASTMENYKFARELIEQRTGASAGEITFITNKFHIFRSRMLAERNGLRAYALASGDSREAAAMYVREYFALIKSFVFDR